MAPSRYGLLPKGTPGFGPGAIASTAGMVYMRPQWKAVKPYQPGLRPQTPSFGPDAVKSTSAMVYMRPKWKAGKPYQPGLRLKRKLGCRRTVDVTPKSSIIQMHTRPKTVKPALTGPGLHMNLMFGYGKTITVKPKSDMVQTHTQQKVTKPALSSHGLRPNRMPVCGKAVTVKPKSNMVQTHTRPKAVQPSLSSPGLRPNRMPVYVKAVVVKPKSSMVQKHTRQKAVKQAPSGLGLGTNGTSGRDGKKKAVKQRSGFVQSYIPLPQVTPSFLETVQEMWYVGGLKPIRRGKKQKPVAEKRMQIFISDPRVDSELVSIYQCSPKEWKLMNWNFQLVSENRQQKTNIHAKGDPAVLAWIVQWSTGQQKTLDRDNVHELLRAAIFFKGKILIQNCLAFFREHNLEFAKLEGRFLERLVPYLTNMDIERLAYLKNYKGNLIRHLYFKLTCALMKTADPHRGHFVNLELLFKCGFCKKLVPTELEDRISCVSLADRTTLGKQVLVRRRNSEHRTDHSWSVERYSRKLLGTVKYWRSVYWLLWSETHYLDCVNCNLTFPVQEMFTCPLDAQHEPRIRNLAEHAIYTTFRKNFQLIIRLYRLKQAKPKEEHKKDDKVQVRPIMDLPKLGLRIPYGRKSANMSRRYMGKGHSWQYNKPLIINKLNQIRYEINIQGRIRHYLRRICVQRKYKRHTQNKSKLKTTRPTERRGWVSIHYRPQGGVYTELMHKWQQMIIKNQKPIVKIPRPKLTFSAQPTSFEIRRKCTGNENLPDTAAAARTQTRQPNTRPAPRPDPRTSTRPNTCAPKHPKKRTVAPTNISEAVGCNAGSLERRVYDPWEGDTIPLLRPYTRRPKTKAKNCPAALTNISEAVSCNAGSLERRLYDPWEGDTIPLLRPCTRRPKTKAMNCPNLGADGNPTTSLATCTSTIRQTTKVVKRPHLDEEEYPTPSSEAVSCPQRLKTKVSKDRNLGAGEHRSKTPAAQLQNTRGTKVSKDRNLGAGENLTASSKAQPCNLRPRTRLTEHPTLEKGGLKSTISTAQCLITRVKLYSNVGVGENPTSNSAVHACTERLKTRLTKHPNLGSSERSSKPSSKTLSRHPITMVINRPNLGTNEHSSKTLSRHPITLVTKLPSLGSGEHFNKTLSQHSIKMGTECPRSGAGKLLTAVSSAHPCISSYERRKRT